MANVTVPYSEAGKAAFEELDTYLNQFLLSGSWPKLSPGFPMTVEGPATLERWSVVGLNASNRLVMATWNADPEVAVKPIGVVTDKIVVTDDTKSVDIFYSGCFDPAALVWDATFDTDAKKAAAFQGSPAPTQIIIRKRG